MIYILTHRPTDDYSALTGEKRFVFPELQTDSPIDLNWYIDRLIEMFDSSGPDDRIVFNGPNWLIAIAGFVWLTDEKRQRFQILIFNNRTRRYDNFNDEIILYANNSFDPRD